MVGTFDGCSIPRTEGASRFPGTHHGNVPPPVVQPRAQSMPRVVHRIRLIILVEEPVVELNVY